MSVEMISYFVSWLPLVLILLVFMVFANRSRTTNSRILEMNEEIMVLTRQMAESLRNIEKSLEDRKS